MSIETRIIVKCVNCSKVMLDKTVMDRLPVGDDYRAKGSIEIVASHYSSVGVTEDYCCGIGCASEYVKTINI